MTARRAVRSGATYLLALFVLAIVAALLVTLSSVSFGTQIVSLAIVVPILAASLVALRYQRRGSALAFAAGACLGALGVVIRLAVSSQPKLEVGGGLPLIVTLAYVLLGLLVCLANLAAYLELRRDAAGKGDEK